MQNRFLCLLALAASPVSASITLLQASAKPIARSILQASAKLGPRLGQMRGIGAAAGYRPMMTHPTFPNPDAFNTKTATFPSKTQLNKLASVSLQDAAGEQAPSKTQQLNKLASPVVVLSLLILALSTNTDKNGRREIFGTGVSYDAGRCLGFSRKTASSPLRCEESPQKSWQSHIPPGFEDNQKYKEYLRAGVTLHQRAQRLSALHTVLENSTAALQDRLDRIWTRLGQRHLEGDFGW